MRKLMITTAALLAAGSAYAADLPSRAAPIVYAPVFTWAGFYIGLNAGYGFSDSHTTAFVDVGIAPGAAYTFSQGDNGGFIGGAQIGYNWQFGQIVAGVEADIQYADLGHHRDFAPYYFGGGGSSGNYFGTVRGRLGYAFDRALVYLTGGLAYGDFGGSDFFGGSDTKAGWTLGGGFEYAFTPNWTARIEGLYVAVNRGNRYGTVTGLTGGGATTTYAVTSGKNNDVGIVRVGVNYKF